MKYTVDMASCDMIYLSGFMKICAGVQAPLTFCPRNLKAVMLALLPEGIYGARH
jgi:hypothetical protein